MNLRFEHEAFGVHQDVAFSALDLLAPIVSPVLPAYPGALFTDWESTTPALGLKD
jgi:hypothetical protein